MIKNIYLVCLLYCNVLLISGRNVNLLEQNNNNKNVYLIKFQISFKQHNTNFLKTITFRVKNNCVCFMRRRCVDEKFCRNRDIMYLVKEPNDRKHLSMDFEDEPFHHSEEYSEYKESISSTATKVSSSVYYKVLISNLTALLLYFFYKYR